MSHILKRAQKQQNLSPTFRTSALKQNGYFSIKNAELLKEFEQGLIQEMQKPEVTELWDLLEGSQDLWSTLTKKHEIDDAVIANREFITLVSVLQSSLDITRIFLGSFNKKPSLFISI
jgi:hypothetical protein